MRLILSIATPAGLLLVTSSSSVSQTVPAGYRLWVPDQSIEFGILQDSPSAFHAVVERRVEDEDAWRLRLAESLYPALEAMDGSAPCAPGGLPENPWWTSCDPRVPFALTASAVRYYLDRVAALRRGAVTTPGRPLQSATMRYDASGSWESDVEVAGRRFTDVFVARLRLSWRVSCGRLCGWSFTKERLVVISRAGDVLAVTGDGPTPLAVSSIPVDFDRGTARRALPPMDRSRRIPPSAEDRSA